MKGKLILKRVNTTTLATLLVVSCSLAFGAETNLEKHSLVNLHQLTPQEVQKVNNELQSSYDPNSTNTIKEITDGSFKYNPVYPPGLKQKIEDMPVLNQGQFGLCHLFSTVSALDILYGNSNPNYISIVNLSQLEYSIDQENAPTSSETYTLNKYQSFFNNPSMNYTMDFPMGVEGGGSSTNDLAIIKKYGVVTNPGTSTFLNESYTALNLTSTSSVDTERVKINANNISGNINPGNNYYFKTIPSAQPSLYNWYVENYQEASNKLDVDYQNRLFEEPYVIGNPMNDAVMAVKTAIDNGDLAVIGINLFSNAGENGATEYLYPDQLSSKIKYIIPNVWTIDKELVNTFNTDSSNMPDTSKVDNKEKPTMLTYNENEANYEMSGNNASVGQHDILIIGYFLTPASDTNSGGGYFIVRNSWGTTMDGNCAVGNNGDFYVSFAYVSNFCNEVNVIGPRARFAGEGVFYSIGK